MTVISYNRNKCIGCGYCAELDPGNWAMSKKDGKSNLIKSREHKGHYTLKINDKDLDISINAAKNCPVKVIKLNQG